MSDLETRTSAVTATGPGCLLVSVVVCTRGRRASLATCVASLRRLEDPNCEIIVVDNSPNAVVGAVPGGDRIRVVHEPRKGLDFARNRGIEEAVGEIVAFIDDDCEADAHWLRAIRASFADEEVACVTGRVRPGSLGRPSQRWFERISTFDRGRVPRRFARRAGTNVAPGFAAQVGTGCNMAFRRETFDQVGIFDVALDMGTPIGGGGDIDMFVRVLRTGSTTAYAPDAVVHHHHRDTLGALVRQLFGYSASVGALSTKYVLDGMLRRKVALRHQWEWFAWICRATLLRPRGRMIIGVPLLLTCTIGNLYGPLAYLVSRARSRRMMT